MNRLSETYCKFVEIVRAFVFHAQHKYTIKHKQHIFLLITAYLYEVSYMDVPSVYASYIPGMFLPTNLFMYVCLFQG